MGKKTSKGQQRRRNRNKQNNKTKKQQQQQQALDDGDANNSSKPSAILQRVRHAKPDVRHGALAALLNTTFSADHLGKHRHPKKNPSAASSLAPVVAPSLLEAVRNQVMDSDLECAVAATTCLSNYLMFHDGDSNNENNNNNGDGNAMTASWIVLFVGRLKQTAEAICAMAATSSSNNNIDRLATANTAAASSSRGHNNQQRSKTKQKKYARAERRLLALTEQCLHGLCLLTEDNPAALQRLLPAATRARGGAAGNNIATTTVTTQSTAQLRDDFMLVLTEWLQLSSSSPLLLPSATAMASIRALVCRCLHSAFEDNAALVLPWLQAQPEVAARTVRLLQEQLLRSAAPTRREGATAVRSGTMDVTVPTKEDDKGQDNNDDGGSGGDNDDLEVESCLTTARLHAAGAIISCWLVVDNNNNNNSGTIATTATVRGNNDGVSATLGSQVPAGLAVLNNAIKDAITIPFVETWWPDLTNACSAYEEERQDQALEQQVVIKQNQKKEPARLIARRLKQQQQQRKQQQEREREAKQQDMIAAMVGDDNADCGMVCDDDDDADQQNDGDGTDGDGVIEQHRPNAAQHWAARQSAFHEQVMGPTVLALEILANLTNGGNQCGSDNDDDDDEMMDDVTNEEEMLQPPQLDPALAQALLELKIPDRLLQLLQFLTQSVQTLQNAKGTDTDTNTNEMTKSSSSMDTVPTTAVTTTIINAMEDSVPASSNPACTSAATGIVRNLLLASLSELQIKCAACLTHCLLHVFAWQPIQSSQGGNQNQNVWEVLQSAFQHAAISADDTSDDNNDTGSGQQGIASAMVAALQSRPVVRKMIQEDGLELLLRTLVPPQVGPAATANTNNKLKVDRDVITMLGCLCCSEVHSVTVNERVCEGLLNVLNRPISHHASSEEAAVLAETMNVLMDLYGNDDCHPNICHQREVPQHLERAAQQLLQLSVMVQQQQERKQPRGNEEEEEWVYSCVEQWEEAVQNAKRFVQYKKEQSLPQKV